MVDGAATPRRTERDRDTERKRRARSEATKIEIPEVVDPVRRERALEDPIRFLLTYFPDRYSLSFGPHHERMIYDICDRAKYGGRQAIAAPRGCGKSEIAKGLLVYLILSGLCRFPLIGAATRVLAKRIYQDFRHKISQNDLILEDFPEVCYPVRALEGAPQRAARQHIEGTPTNIAWGADDFIRIARVPGSNYSGAKLSFFGLDSAFRGTNIDGDRPDFVLVDDPETEQSARSHSEIERREEMLDKGVAGLVGQEGRLAIVVLTTVQNSICLSARLTDRKIRSSFNGVRFGLVVKWPDRMDLWEEYISKRHAAQREGDEHGRRAVDFYRSNREAMDLGAEMLSDHFPPHSVEGEDLVLSSLQAAFNTIAETSFAAFRSEYQNDPEPEEETITGRLTAARVQGSISRTEQREIPSGAECVTMGIDLGKYVSHWVKIAWEPQAIGTVVDYGRIETVGLSSSSDSKSVEIALASSLEIFAEELAEEGPLPDLIFIDSGTFTGSVYAFCRKAGRPFFPIKGQAGGKFRMPAKAQTQGEERKIPFDECYAHWLPASRVWLYHSNVEHWKQWTHERFLVDTFTDGDRTPGTLALFDPAGDSRRHLSFSQHIVAEELRLVPVHGREFRREWFVRNRNNHFLDATSYACTAAGCVGVRLIDEPEKLPAKPSSGPKPPATRRGTSNGPRFTDPHGRPFVATLRE